MTTVTVPGAYAGFDHNAPQYKCCCQSCHVTTGTKVIAILEAIGLALQLISMIYGISTVGFHGATGFSLLTLAVYIGVLVLVFLALKNEKAAYLIPHLVLQVIYIIFSVIALIACIILLATGSVFLNQILGIEKNRENYSIQVNGETQNAEAAVAATSTLLIVMGIILIITFLLTLMLSIWFFLIVLATYRYFRDKAIYDRSPVGQQGYANTVMQPAYQFQGAQMEMH